MTKLPMHTESDSPTVVRRSMETGVRAETPLFAVRPGTPEGSWRPLPVELFMTELGTSFGKIPDGQLKEFDGIREGIQMTRAAHCEFFLGAPSRGLRHGTGLRWRTCPVLA